MIVCDWRYRSLLALVLVSSAGGCATSPTPPPPAKVAAMIATLDTLATAKDAGTAEVRHYVSIAPTTLNTTLAASGDHRRYEIVFSDQTIDTAEIATLTEVVIARDGAVKSRMDLFVWDRQSWVSGTDWYLRRHPAGADDGRRR